MKKVSHPNEIQNTNTYNKYAVNLTNNEGITLADHYLYLCGLPIPAAS